MTETDRNSSLSISRANSAKPKKNSKVISKKASKSVSKNVSKCLSKSIKVDCVTGQKGIRAMALYVSMCIICAHATCSSY